MLSDHPSDEMLETYSLNQTSLQEAHIIEDHVLGCELCRGHLFGVNDSHLIRAAFRLGFSVHRAENGPLAAWIESEGYLWVGRIEENELRSLRKYYSPEKLSSEIMASSAAFPSPVYLTGDEVQRNLHLADAGLAEASTSISEARKLLDIMRLLPDTNS